MLLSIDTSTAQTGLALYDGSQVVGESLWVSRAHHTQELAPALANLLARTGVGMHEISALGVAIGPGSFTSLRVGLSFAKGLALARKLPVVGIPTLDIVACAQPPAEFPLLAVLQAGRGRLAQVKYHAADNGWQAEGGASITNVDALVESIQAPVVVCGELKSEERQKIHRNKNALLASPAACVRRPAFLAELAWVNYQAGRVDNAATLAPVYLHVAGALPE